MYTQWTFSARTYTPFTPLHEQREKKKLKRNFQDLFSNEIGDFVVSTLFTLLEEHPNNAYASVCDTMPH